MEIVIFCLIVLLLLAGVVSAGIGSQRGEERGESRKESEKVTINFANPATHETIFKGVGYSIGGAMINGFANINYSLSVSSSEKTIQSRLDIMRRSLSLHQDQMSAKEIARCKEYIQTVENKAVEKRNLASKKLREREKKRHEKEMPEQRRFIAEQRRLMSDSLRYEVLRRDGFRCQICGATANDGVKLHVDHIFPVSKGGKTELSNLRTLCERCNMGKRDKIESVSNAGYVETYTPDEFAEKFAK